MSAKRKASARFAPPAVKSAIKVPTKARIDESRTAVSSTDNIQASARNQTQETIDISSDSNSDDDDDEDASDDGAGSDNLMNGVEATGVAPSIAAAAAAAAANSTTQATTTDTADADSEDAEDATSPSFGELLRGTIDVPAILSQQALSSAPKASSASKALTATTTTVTTTTPLDPPSLSSLSTVLTQALRTEDTELLESCLQITDTPSIHATIERLDSALAGVLLTRLAARFHRRPGRAGSLMTWVKWTLVAHGGALALQPKVLDRLVALQKVLNERARGLPSLLALKGKLDMLDAQMQLRQSRQRGGGRGADEEEEEGDDDDEDEEGAIYVEGEEADVDVAIAEANGALLALEEGDDDVPGTNGFAADSDVDDDDSDVEEPESDDDGEEVLDEDDVDHLDVEDSMDEDEDSDAEAAPPSKLRKTARSFGKRR